MILDGASISAATADGGHDLRCDWDGILHTCISTRRQLHGNTYKLASWPGTAGVTSRFHALTRAMTRPRPSVGGTAFPDGRQVNVARSFGGLFGSANWCDEGGP